MLSSLGGFKLRVLPVCRRPSRLNEPPRVAECVSFSARIWL